MLYRLQNWEDRRFPQQKSFWQLRIAPREAYLSTPWTEATHAFVDQDQIACCRLSGFPQEFFEASHGIWPKVLAHLTLTRREREHWQSMRAVDKRRHDWLLGRCAAKDAVRLLIKKRLGVQLAPAEIEIVPDAFGRPQIEGAWVRRLRIQPVVSISHCSGTAVALAAADASRMVGIDIESLSQERGEFQSLAFTQQERDLIAALGHELRHEWSLRIWCAKEALSKALGRGLSAGLHAVRVAEAEIESGVVQLELYDGLLKEFPQLRGKQMTAHTSRENDLVFSTIVYQKGVVQ
jgi:phosphopantetheinyl transferase